MNVGHPQGRVCMRDVIITENITLDGVVEATDNWFGPAGSPSEVDQSDHERTGSIAPWRTR